MKLLYSRNSRFLTHTARTFRNRTTIVVEDLYDIEVGMRIFISRRVAQSSFAAFRLETTITAIDVDTKTITIADGLQETINVPASDPNVRIWVPVAYGSGIADPNDYIQLPDGNYQNIFVRGDVGTDRGRVNDQLGLRGTGWIEGFYYKEANGAFSDYYASFTSSITSRSLWNHFLYRDSDPGAKMPVGLAQGIYRSNSSSPSTANNWYLLFDPATNRLYFDLVVPGVSPTNTPAINFLVVAGA